MERKNLIFVSILLIAFLNACNNKNKTEKVELNNTVQVNKINNSIINKVFIDYYKNDTLSKVTLDFKDMEDIDFISNLKKEIILSTKDYEKNNSLKSAMDVNIRINDEIHIQISSLEDILNNKDIILNRLDIDNNQIYSSYKINNTSNLYKELKILLSKIK